MAKKTTVKPIGLGYREVASSGEYTKLMGVLKGLTIGQDTPDSTEIEAEFYDSPFDIYYDGNPVTMTFELANYELSELVPLFGGSYDENTDTYEGATNAFTSEHEWKLDFGRGFSSLVIVRGLTIGTLKKDADGALNYSVTITALVYTDNEDKDHMYKIVGNTSTVTARILSVNGKTAGQEAPTLRASGNTIVFTSPVTIAQVQGEPPIRFYYEENSVNELANIDSGDGTASISFSMTQYGSNFDTIKVATEEYGELTIGFSLVEIDDQTE